MVIVIIMGLSGAGKTLALHKLEDKGFFCIDNLPSNLLSQLITSLSSFSDIDKVAFCLDSRTPALEFTKEQMELLRDAGHDVKTVFLTASDDVLIKRYGETRRTHPMSRQGFIDDAIAQERTFMEGYKEIADVILDTSHWRPSQLYEALDNILPHEEENGIVLQIRSFGYKHGVPADADWVVDMRFLPNPFWVPELRQLSGKDAPVQDYLTAQPQSEQFLRKFSDLLFPLLSAYEKEGKMRLLLCVGCTGGQHRSVFIAEQLAKMGEERGLSVLLQHRDVQLSGRGGSVQTHT